jgi:hypothetical protein
MEKQSVPTGPGPEISIKAQGDLVVKGWDELEVQVKSSSEDLTFEQDGDRVRISSLADCTLRVPYEASLQVEKVAGQAVFKTLDGAISIEEASGNLLLRAVGPVAIGNVRGNLTAKNVAGDLKVGSVYGNATIRDVQGDFVIEDSVRGNLSLDDVDENVSASARGNIILRLDPAPGNKYSFTAGGNITVRITNDASAQVNIPQAAKVLISLPDQKTSQAETPYTFTLGEGDADLTLSAQGNVIIGSQARDWGFEGLELEEDFEGMVDAINQQVEQQINAQMEMLEHTLESQLADLSNMFTVSGLSPEKAERIAERTRLAQERAQEKIRRAQEKLQRKLEAARRRAEQRARNAAARAARDRRKRPQPFDWTPPPPEPAKEPVSEEERLMILQMLEQGKITLDEAEQLLAALEGKG